MRKLDASITFTCTAFAFVRRFSRVSQYCRLRLICLLEFAIIFGIVCNYYQCLRLSSLRYIIIPFASLPFLSLPRYRFCRYRFRHNRFRRYRLRCLFASLSSLNCLRRYDVCISTFRCLLGSMHLCFRFTLIISIGKGSLIWSIA